MAGCLPCRQPSAPGLLISWSVRTLALRSCQGNIRVADFTNSRGCNQLALRTVTSCWAFSRLLATRASQEPWSVAATWPSQAIAVPAMRPASTPGLNLWSSDQHRPDCLAGYRRTRPVARVSHFEDGWPEPFQTGPPCPTQGSGRPFWRGTAVGRVRRADRRLSVQNAPPRTFLRQSITRSQGTIRPARCVS